MDEQEQPTTPTNGTHEAPYELVEPRANQMVRQGFAGMEISADNQATAALVASARANIEARFVMAMRFPRDMSVVRQKILLECRRPGFAKAAMYNIPRGGKTISGLSIRFAEAACRAMGNMSVNIPTLFDSDYERVVKVIVTDYESNATWDEDITVKKTVERKQLAKGQRAIRERANSFGDRLYIVEATDDDVMTKSAALVSKKARTLILRMVPGNIQDEAKALCRQIAADENAKDPDANRNRMVDAFASIGVSVSELVSYLGCELAKVTSDQMTFMSGLYNAIKDGEAKWSDAVQANNEARGNAEAKAADKTPNTPQTPASATATAAEKTAPKNDPKPEAAKGGKGVEAVKSKIRETKAATTGPTQTPEEARLAKLAEERPKANTNDAPPKTEAAKPQSDAQPKTEPASAAPKTEPAPEAKALPPQMNPEPLRLVPPPGPGDFEIRPCSMCGAETEVLKTTPAGAQVCDPCSNS